MAKKYKKRFLINNLNRIGAEHEGYSVGQKFYQKTKQGNVEPVAYAYETPKSRGRNYRFQKGNFEKKRYDRKKARRKRRRWYLLKCGSCEYFVTTDLEGWFCLFNCCIYDYIVGWSIIPLVVGYKDKTKCVWFSKRCLEGSCWGCIHREFDHREL